MSKGKIRWLLILIWSFAQICQSQLPSSEEIYRINPGDVLEIKVWDNPVLSGEQTVGPDGTIRLPLIGSVRAMDLTLDELTERLHQELKKFLRQPLVHVSLRQFSPLYRRVYILGEVKSPGVYVLPAGAPATVIDAITLAGGFTINADLRRVRVFRKDGQLIQLDLKNFQVSGTTDSSSMRISPGDLVWVAPDYVKVSVIGVVEKGGIYLVPADGSLLDAVATAGGVKDPTATVKVFRRGSEVLSVMWSQLESGEVPPISLRDGDTILVLVKEAVGVVVAGAVSNPGVFNLKGKVTLLGALAMAGAGTDTTRPLQIRVQREGKDIVSVRWRPSQTTPIEEFSLELRSGDIVMVEPLLIRATLVGSVRTPGSYELPSGSRLVDLVAKGGEIFPSADLMSVTLIRKGETKSVNLLKILLEGEMEENLELKDEDILILPTLRKVLVFGAVLRPGAIDYQPNMTVVDAIGVAGGPRSPEEAEINAIQIVSGNFVRTVNLEAIFKGGTPPYEPIRPGDVVIVPERKKAYVYGGVFRPGAVWVRHGDTVLQILSHTGGPVAEAKLKDAVLVRFVNNQPVVMKLDLERAIRKGDLSQDPIVQPGDLLYIPIRRAPRYDVPQLFGLASSAFFWISQLK